MTVIVSVDTGLAGSAREDEFEISDEELAKYETEEDRKAFIEKEAFEAAMNLISWYWTAKG